MARLFYWQFLANIDTRSNFDQQSEIPASRGEIFTSDGFPLVTNQQAFLVYGKPHDLKQKPEDIAKIMAPDLISEKFATISADAPKDLQDEKENQIKQKEEDLTKKLSDQNLIWVQLARKIPLTIKQKIEKYKIEGLGFEDDEKRFYPEAPMAAQLLGFVGSDKFGRDTGYFGLEGYYDQQLRGRPGRLGQESDPYGFPILVGRYRPIKPQKGASLYLTIDRTIQFFAQQELSLAVDKYGAKDGTVIVANPKNGNILAMATYPTYNPALWPEFDQKLYRNSAVADTYEPGSTFKLITMSSALDLSLVDPNTKCPVCQGPRQIGGYEISTWNKQYFPNSTIAEVIQHSDNVGMTFVSEKLGLDKFYDYITKFGFGKKTGIDLQEESPGVIRNKKDWHIIDLATASFGQGLAVTPIQMIQAVGAIANGGKLINPKIVEKIKDGGSVDTITSQEKQVISPKAATQMTEMMVNAVEKGEAQYFTLKGYRIAGKTGTAQIPVAGHYDPNKTVASFIGFAPADDPKFVMLVRFTEPTASIFGAETAAPTFFSIAKHIFGYWSITPTRN